MTAVPGALEAIDEVVLIIVVVSNCDDGGISWSRVGNKVISLMAIDEKILVTVAVSDGYGCRIGIFVKDADSAGVEIEKLKWAR